MTNTTTDREARDLETIAKLRGWLDDVEQLQADGLLSRSCELLLLVDDQQPLGGTARVRRALDGLGHRQRTLTVRQGRLEAIRVRSTGPTC